MWKLYAIVANTVINVSWARPDVLMERPAVVTANAAHDGDEEEAEQR